MTKREFLDLYAERLKARHLWATDPEHLARYLDAVAQAIAGAGDVWTPHGAALADVWRIMGYEGEPSKDVLCNLPDHEGTQ